MGFLKGQPQTPPLPTDCPDNTIPLKGNRPLRPTGLSGLFETFPFITMTFSSPLPWQRATWVVLKAVFDTLF